MHHPTRPGSRGGKDQFNWEDVKDDKHRINYIGNSLMAPVGSWQKGRDVQWYSRGKKGSDADEEMEKARKAELQKIKEQEELAMAEALGLKVKRKPESNLSTLDLKKAIRNSEEGHDNQATNNGDDIAGGLGYKNKRYGSKGSASSSSLIPEFEKADEIQGSRNRIQSHKVDDDNEPNLSRLEKCDYKETSRNHRHHRHRSASRSRRRRRKSRSRTRSRSPSGSLRERETDRSKEHRRRSRSRSKKGSVDRHNRHRDEKRPSNQDYEREREYHRRHRRRHDRSRSRSRSSSKSRRKERQRHIS